MGGFFKELVGWRLGIGLFSWERAESPFGAAKNRIVKTLEHKVRQGWRFWHRKCSGCVSGFGVCHPEKAEFVLKLDPLERAACSNCEVGLWAIPRSPTEGAKIVDKVEAHSVSLFLFTFLFFSPVPLVWWCRQVHCESEFQEDALFRPHVQAWLSWSERGTVNP